MTEDHERLYNVCLSTAQFLAAIVLGIWGLISWRRQLFGKYHFALAAKISTQVYKLNAEIISFLRYALKDSGDFWIKKIMKMHSRLIDSVGVAHVLWGEPIKQAEIGLTETVNEFTTYVRMYHEKYRGKTIPDSSMNEPLIRQFRVMCDIIDPPGVPDEFGVKLAIAVGRFRPILDRHLPQKTNPLVDAAKWISRNFKRLSDAVQKPEDDPK